MPRDRSDEARPNHGPLVVAAVCTAAADASLLWRSETMIVLGRLLTAVAAFHLALWGASGGATTGAAGCGLAFANVTLCAAIGQTTIGGIWGVIGVLVYAVGLLAAAPVYKANTKPRRKKYDCPRCGYLLVYLEVQRCPECGRPFSFEELAVEPEELHFAQRAGGSGQTRARGRRC